MKTIKGNKKLESPEKERNHWFTEQQTHESTRWMQKSKAAGPDITQYKLSWCVMQQVAGESTTAALKLYEHTSFVGTKHCS